MNRDTTRRVLILTAVLLCLAASAFARPNFTGKWTLDSEKSYLGPFADLTVLVRDVHHDDPRLIISVEADGSRGKQTGEMRFLTQREEVTNTVAGVETTGHVMWLGDHLLMKTTRDWDGLSTTLEELWTLSDDGKTLRVDAVVTTPNGKEELLAVFQKQ